MTAIRYLLDENLPHGVRNQLLYHNPNLEDLLLIRSASALEDYRDSIRYLPL